MHKSREGGYIKTRRYKTYKGVYDMVNTGQYIAKGVVCIEDAISIKRFAREFADNEGSSDIQFAALERFAEELEKAFCVGEYKKR